MSRVWRLLAPAALALGCSGGDLVLPENGTRATAITAAGGDGQTGAVGSALDDPLVVAVTDDEGRPVEGVTVRWAASAGGVDPGSSTTDARGRASTRRILGDDLGAQSATATSPELDGSPVRFEHTAVPGDAARLVKVAGDAQTARVGTTLSTTLVVRLLDASDNPVAGRAVTWLVTGGGGSISPAEGTTDGSGRSSAQWRLGTAIGRQTATAVVSGVGRVEFTATATSGSVGGGGDDDDDNDDDGKGGKGGGKGGGSGSIAPSRVAMWRGNEQTALAGSAVAAPPAVIVTDAAGRGVQGVDVSYAVIAGGGRITGETSSTDADGVAAVGSWVLGAGGTNRLRATVQRSGIVGNPITFSATATVPRPPDRLVFRVQPRRTEEDDRIEPAVQVAVVSGGRVVTGYRGEVRVELRGGDRRAKLRGSSREELSNGIATFRSLRVDREGRGYRLQASVSGLPSIESDAFDIVDD